MYCALIGDLIASRKIKPEDRMKLQNKLKQTLNKINQEYQKEIASPFLITLGDEFQGLFKKVEPALMVIEELNIALAPHKIRFGVGIGEMTTSINQTQALGDDGPAYHRARDGVEALKKRKYKGFPVLFRTGNPDESLLDASLLLLNRLVESWSSAQEEYVYAMERMAEQDFVAIELGVKQSSVSRALKRANYEDYIAVKRKLADYLFEAYDAETVEVRNSCFLRAKMLAAHGSVDLAEKILQKLLAEKNTGENAPMPMELYGLMGVCLYKRGAFERGAQFYQKAMEEAQKQNLTAQQVSYCQRIVNCYLELALRASAVGKKEILDRAEMMVKQGLVLAKAHTYPVEKDLLNTLAVLYSMQGRREDTVIILEELLQNMERSNDKNLGRKAACYNNLAGAYMRNETWEKAGEYARKSVEFLENGADKASGCGHAYFALGKYYTHKGEYPQAIEYYKEAEAYFQRDKRYDVAADVYTYIAKTFQKMGNEDDAKRFELAAQAMRKKWKSKETEGDEDFGSY